jgi:hypothetical protein
LKRLVIFPATLLFAFTLYGQGVTIHGKILVEKTTELGPSTVLVKEENKCIATASVDRGYTFQIKVDDLKTSTSSVRADLFITGIGMDTSFIKSITLINNSAINCDLEFPNLHNKNVLGEVTCPKCGKTDKILHIVWGRERYDNPEVIPTRHINKSDTTYTSKDFVISTSERGRFSPSWYCKRCNIKF